MLKRPARSSGNPGSGCRRDFSSRIYRAHKEATRALRAPQSSRGFDLAQIFRPDEYVYPCRRITPEAAR